LATDTLVKLPGQRFRAVSYNIHRCVGVDGRKDPGRIAEVIRELGADIVGLQEVDAQRGEDSGFDPMQKLAKASGFHLIPGVTILRDDEQYGNALMTGRRVREIRRLDLSLPGREPRGAIDVDLDLEGESIRVLVTHLGLRPRERRAQVRKMLDVLRVKPDHLTIVMGDINEWLPGSRTLRWLHGRLGRSPARRTYPSFFPLLSLDRIWVWPIRALLSVRAHDSPTARIASDHLPLAADVAAMPLLAERMPSLEAPPSLDGDVDQESELRQK
jgi:endonuclease/exonuclease/phosphatase family metal-dependent hydrolase